VSPDYFLYLVLLINGWLGSHYWFVFSLKAS
jgi:hypothetical protein